MIGSDSKVTSDGTAIQGRKTRPRQTSWDGEFVVESETDEQEWGKLEESSGQHYRVTNGRQSPWHH